MYKKGMCLSYKGLSWLVLKDEDVISEKICVVNEEGVFCEFSKSELGVLPLDSTMTDRETLDSLVLFAFRYALGRMTYAPYEVIRAVKKHSDILSQNTKSLIVKEIKERVSQGMKGLGWDCDARAWIELVEFLTKDHI